ncbi:MAG TPA: hypothetical protein VF885_20020 [Arthrobacter sp.]
MNVYEAFQAAKAAGCTQPEIYIAFSPASFTSASGWLVARSGTYSRKRFPGNKAREEGLQAAMDWASRRYGISGWEKIPGFGGTYFPAESAPAIKAAKRAAEKAAQ